MATATSPAADAARPAAPPIPAAPQARRRFVLPVVALLVLAGLFYAFNKWSYARGHETTDNAQLDGHIVPVLARVGGYVAAVRVDENDVVERGQILVQLDTADLAVRLRQAEAELAAAQAATGEGGTTGQAEAQVQTAASQRSALDAGVAAARATAVQARADLGRQRELAERQIVSRQQLDAAQAAATAADAQLRAAEQQAAAAGAGVTNARAGVRLAQARLEAAEAAVANARLQLGYARLTAPTSGTVARKGVEIGQLVQPGQPLLSIVSDSGVFVTANFKETQLDQIRVGQRVEIEVDAYGGAKVEGAVESISSATGAKFALLPPDNATGNFTKVVQRVPVRIRVTKGLGADRPLRPGMSVEASVATTR
jgi:membrane fusion protein (multidrug efflux system)